MQNGEPVNRRLRRRATFIAVGVVLSLTGCGSEVLDDPYGKPSASDSEQAAAKLSTLPSLEDTETQVGQAADELAAYIGTVVPGAEWTAMGDRMVSGCNRPYNGTNGSKVFLPDRVAKIVIPEEVWPQVFDRAREISARLGATEVEKFHDEPGNHDVRFYNREGTSIHLGAAGNTVIDAQTGCRLPQAEIGATPPSTTPTP